MRRFEANTGIKAELSSAGELDSLPDDEEIAVFRVVQEALANIGRHAEAARVGVSLAATDGGVELRVTDDGRGFDVGSTPRKGLGLDGMAERARLVGGELTIESRPGAGTALTLRVR